MAEKEGVVFIGTKPPMSYVLAVVTQFREGNKIVQVKARGKAISRAVDVSEIVKNRFLEGLKIGTIKTGTESLKGERGDTINVSLIEIPLIKDDEVIKQKPKKKEEKKE
ncbi:MAG: DNA-binding protein Alba [Candidatus Altiarchaeota archaeon]|nr:DNA-binding protein Alba [Candidatus Altiarchaeota archaeon]